MGAAVHLSAASVALRAGMLGGWGSPGVELLASSPLQTKRGEST